MSDETTADNSGYTEVDCMNELSQYLKKRKGEGSQIVRFSDVDTETKMPAGSSKMYLVKAAEAEGLATSDEGNINVKVDFGSPPPRKPFVIGVSPTRGPRSGRGGRF